MGDPFSPVAGCWDQVGLITIRTKTTATSSRLSRATIGTQLRPGGRGCS
jgi:hypothetical protein